MKLLCAALLAVLHAALCSPARAVKVERIPVTSPAAGGPTSMEVVAEQILVRFSTTTPPAGGKAAALAAVGASVLQELPSVGWTVVALSSGAKVTTGLAAARALPGVEKAEPNHVYRPNILPNDPNVIQQYGLSQIDAYAAWDMEHGQSNRVTIAMIDSGVLPTHAEFSGKFSGPAQFFDPNAVGAQSADVAGPACNHGTRTAGIAAAQGNNGAGAAGVSWDARLVSLKVFANGDCNPTGDCPGTCVTTDPALIGAINYAAAQQNVAAFGRVVINLSVGGAAACAAAVQTALNNAAAAGVPSVISSGNDGGAVNTPANCATAAGGTGIIPVGATDSGNNVAGFSSRGPELAANGVVAPGVGIFTTDVSGGYTGGANGTSFSAPHVAGLAALILSARAAACTNLACAQDVQTKIRAGSENIGVSAMSAPAGIAPAGNAAGAGRINAFRSVRLAVRGTLAGFEGDQKVIAFPNPFKVSENGIVSFAIPPGLQGSGANIKIFTVAGELVKELTTLAWDGKNTGGSLVASGTYIFFVSTSAGKAKGRLAVIR